MIWHFLVPLLCTAYAYGCGYVAGRLHKWNGRLNIYFCANCRFWSFVEPFAWLHYKTRKHRIVGASTPMHSALKEWRHLPATIEALHKKAPDMAAVLSEHS